MGLWQTIKNVHPINPAADAVTGALNVGQPIKTEPMPIPTTGQAAADLATKEAVNVGEQARQEAIARGKGQGD